MSSGKLQPMDANNGTVERRNYSRQQGPNVGVNLLRAQLTMKTWVALGAALQLALFSLPIKPYYAATPVIAYLAVEIIGSLMIMTGLRADPQRADMVETKYTALVPNEEGTFKSGTQGQKISVFLLAFRCQHHLGLLAPGFKDMSSYAQRMFDELEEKAAEYNLLSISTYNNISATTKVPEIMLVMHFKSNEDIVRYSQSPLHREGWDWYNRITKKWPHIGIMHEMYEAPAGKWEGIYKNIAPTLLATSRHKVVDEDGNEKWMSGMIEASRGKISSTSGRLA